MIALDIETSGINYKKCGIWQIGAVDLESEEEFFEESKIDEEDSIEEGATKVIGKTEKELRNPEKQSQKQLIINFLKWMDSRKIKSLICQNPQFDYSFIKTKTEKYGLDSSMPHRCFDLHTISQLIYYHKNKGFLIKNGKSGIGFTETLKMCGIEDKRIKLDGEKVIKKGTPHNALEDARLTANCFKELLKQLK